MSRTKQNSAPTSRYFLLLASSANEMVASEQSLLAEKPRKTRRAAFAHCPEHLFSVDDAALKAASILGR